MDRTAPQRGRVQDSTRVYPMTTTPAPHKHRPSPQLKRVFWTMDCLSRTRRSVRFDKTQERFGPHSAATRTSAGLHSGPSDDHNPNTSQAPTITPAQAGFLDYRLPESDETLSQVRQNAGAFWTAQRRNADECRTALGSIR